MTGFEEYQVFCWCDADVWVGESWIHHHVEVERQCPEMLQWLVDNTSGRWGFEPYGGVRSCSNTMIYFELPMDKVSFVIRWI